MLTHDQKIKTMFDMALSFLYDSQLDDAYSMVQARIMYRRGEQDGRTAAEWFFSPHDGKDGEVARQWLQGIKDGDPLYTDQLPGPSLGGEFADDPTFRDIVLDELDIDINQVIEDNQWLTEYEEGFNRASEDHITKILQSRVNDEKLAEKDNADY